MTLKKKLNKFLSGQTTLEYVMLLTVIALVTLLAFSAFYPQVKRTIQGDAHTIGFFQNAVDRVMR